MKIDKFEKYNKINEERTQNVHYFWAKPKKLADRKSRLKSHPDYLKEGEWLIVMVIEPFSERNVYIPGSHYKYDIIDFEMGKKVTEIPPSF
jgi:hypothetical protein